MAMWSRCARPKRPTSACGWLITTRSGPLIPRQIRQLGLADIGADAELEIVQPGTDLAEFYQLSMAALAGPMISAGLMTAGETARVSRARG